jgi:ADP-heptose:LPS heptosyltransferase
MDAVIAVDTAVCHLAGSMGVPTILLLRYSADWKWGVNDTTPWYPSMRILRQPEPGDWPGLVARMRTLLTDTQHGLLPRILGCA